MANNLNIESLTIPSDQELIKALTGRGGKFRASKPKNGFAAFVWRWIRFHANIDCHIPSTDEFWLCDWVEEQVGHKVGWIEFSNSVRKDLVKIGDSKAEQLASHFGLSKYAGAARWAKAFGIL